MAARGALARILPAQQRPMTARQPKRRRLRIVVLVLVIGLFLIAVSPYAAAPLIEGLVEARLSESLHGRATIEHFSLGWPGKARIAGLHVVDEEGEPLATVQTARASVSPLRALSGSYDVDVAVEGFELHVRRGADGAWNVADLGGTGDEDEEEEGPSEVPNVRARISVLDGRVVLHAGEVPTRVEGIRLDAVVPSLSAPAELSFGLAVVGPDGPAGTLAGRARIAAAPGGSWRPTGTVNVRIQDLDLASFAPLVEESAPVRDLAGKLQAETDLTLRGLLDAEGWAELVVTDLTASGPREGVPPAQLDRVHVRADLVAQGSAGEQELSVDAGTLLQLDYRGRTERAGEATSIDGTLRLASAVAELASLSRGWVPLREGLELAGALAGRVEIDALVPDSGAPSAELDADLELHDLAATDAEGRALDPGSLANVTLSVAGRFDGAAERLSIPELAIVAGSVRVDGRADVAGWGEGSALAVRDTRFALEADLDRLADDAAAFFDLGENALGGKLSGEVTLAGEGGHAEASGRLTAQALRLSGAALGPDGIALRQLVLEARGSYDEASDTARIERWSAVGDFLDWAGSGSVTDVADAGRRTVTLSGAGRVDPSSLGTTLAGLLEGTRVAGDPLAGELDVAQTSDALALVMRWRGSRIAIARPDSPPLEQRDFALALDVQQRTSVTVLDVRELSYRSPTIEVTGRGAYDAEGPSELAFEAAGALERILTDFGLEEPTPGRSTSGALTVDARVSGTPEALAVDGSARIADFVLVVPDAEGGRARTIREPAIDVRLAATLSPRAETLALEALTFTSSFLHGTVTGAFSGLGALSRPRTAEVGDGDAAVPATSELVIERFHGDLRYVPDDLGAVLAPWLPGELSGREEQPIAFDFAGRTRDLALDSLLAGVEGTATIGVGRLRTPTVETWGTAALTVRDGRARARADLRANGGTVTVRSDLELAAARDAAPAEEPPASRLVLSADDVEARSGLAPLLSHLHPVFTSLRGLRDDEIGGLVSAALDVRYDGELTPEVLARGWEALPKERISGTGSFEVARASLANSDLLGKLLGALGVDTTKEFEIRPIEFTITRGRIAYARPWKWSIDGVPTSFTGTVGLDETLDLEWQLPITDKLVKQQPLLSSLQGQSFTLPIGGTITRPRLDFDDTLKELVSTAARTELTKNLGLGGGGGGRDDPAALMEQADALWDAGRKAEAARIYERIEDDFKVSLVYLLNRDRIKKRAKFKP